MWVVSVWCVVMVVCVSPPGCRSEAPQLTPELLTKTIMPQIWNNYGIERPVIERSCSFAISIPFHEEYQRYDLDKVFAADTPAEVITTLNAGKVYKGKYVVAAKQSQSDVFDAKTVKGTRPLNAVAELPGRDLMIFYTLSSPDWDTAMAPDHAQGILEKIKVLREWRQYALVFTWAFQRLADYKLPPATAEASRVGALSRLGGSLGLDHVYRCFPKHSHRPPTETRPVFVDDECFRCAGEKNAVLHRCVTLEEVGWMKGVKKG